MKYSDFSFIVVVLLKYKSLIDGAVAQLCLTGIVSCTKEILLPYKLLSYTFVKSLGCFH